MKRYLNYIDGRAADPSSGEWFEAIDPYTKLPWALIPRCNAQDANLAIDAAYRAFHDGAWADMLPSKRGAVLRQIGDVFSQRVEKLAEIETRDNGRPLADTLKQIRYLPEWFYYYGGLADKVEGQVIPIDQEDIFNYTKYEPLGVVVAITPWNSPLMLACWKLAPILAAGNTVVIKPSEHASASTIELMDVMKEAGVPPGVVNSVTGFPEDIGSALINDPHIAKISFTGSTAVGRHIGKQAAEKNKQAALELGGKSAQIICEDACIEKAVNGVISGIYLSNGQSCVAGSRLLLHESIQDVFLKKLCEKTAQLKMGDPGNLETQIGPIANEPQFEKIMSYIEIGKEEGANCLIGGVRSSRYGCADGWFIEPTIFTDVKSSMRIAQEEIFGPVLSVMTYLDDDEAIRIANDTDYGLATGVWTMDMHRAYRYINKLECGTVYVNQYRNVSVTSPAGGYKQSGIGRENGPEMIKEFLQVKSVWINTAG